LQAILADNLLQARVVSSLDQSESVFPFLSSYPLPTAEIALQARIGGHMGNQDPGASPRRHCWGFHHPFEA
ncbi:MAG: hypothetical protein ACREJ8_08235, partial [Candidatus Methylomirabilales bacterium]